MKILQSHDFDPLECQQELVRFKELLGSSNSLGERKHILPFFQDHRNLSALIGHYNGNICKVDRIAFECDLFGDFACDLVVGDSNKHAYNFIEFEDAAPNSLFVQQGGKATREWSRRLEGGYSQIIDWFYKLADLEGTHAFHGLFESPSINFTGTLIIGRDEHIRSSERRRFDWRRYHVLVDSKPIFCYTFDELYEDFKARLENFPPAAKADKYSEPTL